MYVGAVLTPQRAHRMPKQELQSLRDDNVLWNVQRCALHLGVTAATVRRYIRGGLKTEYGLVNRADLIREYLKRGERQRANQGTRRKDNSQ